MKIKKLVFILITFLILSPLLFLSYCVYEIDKLATPMCSIWINEQKLSREEKIKLYLEHANNSETTSVLIKTNEDNHSYRISVRDQIPYPNIEHIQFEYPDCCKTYPELEPELRKFVVNNTHWDEDTIILHYPGKTLDTKTNQIQEIEIFQYFDFKNCN